MGGKHMKKNLILTLALVFVLGIASTAFAAANPFVDVPAKHWAYDAVTKLAQAGILDGYGDGTYKGGNLATRYEMAQATAKAMARSDKANAANKALIDKLAVEFAAELNNLGVRVAKLESRASTLQFTGDVRLRYQSNTNLALSNATEQIMSRTQERIRLNANAPVNDKLTFNARLTAQYAQSVGGPAAADSPFGVSYTGTGKDMLVWEVANFKYMMTKDSYFQIGRMMAEYGDLGRGNLYGYTGMLDGIEMAFGLGSALQATIGYVDVNPNLNYALSQSTLTSPNAEYKLNYKANFGADFNSQSVYPSGSKYTNDSSYVTYGEIKWKPSDMVSLYGLWWWSFDSDRAKINMTPGGDGKNSDSTAIYATSKAGGSGVPGTYTGTVGTASPTSGGTIFPFFGYPFQIWGLGFSSYLDGGKNWTLDGFYFNNSSSVVANAYPSDNHSAWIAKLTYGPQYMTSRGAALNNKPGTWGANISYKDVKPYSLDWNQISGTVFSNDTSGVNAMTAITYGVKGFTLEASYLLQKGLMLTATYQTLSRNSAFDGSQIAPYYYLQALVLTA